MNVRATHVKMEPSVWMGTSSIPVIVYLDTLAPTAKQVSKTSRNFTDRLVVFTVIKTFAIF